MGILSGYKKIERYIKQSSGYQKISQWTNAQSVEFNDGTNLEDHMKLKADINSPILTGTPKAPTADSATDSTQIATTAFVQTCTDKKIADLINGAPTTLDTLGEIAEAMAENASVVEALNDSIGKKIDALNGDSHIESTKTGSAVTITHKDTSRKNTSSTVSLANGGVFTAIDSLTSDIKGHITSVNTKTITLPTIDVSISPLGERIEVRSGDNYAFEEYLVGKVLLVFGAYMSGFAVYHTHLRSNGQPTELDCIYSNMDNNNVNVMCNITTDYHVVIVNNSNDLIYVTVI